MFSEEKGVGFKKQKKPKLINLMNLPNNERARIIRKIKKLSQQDLAKKAGLHRTYISEIERGKVNVSLDNIEKLTVALDVNIVVLLNVKSLTDWINDNLPWR